VSWKRFSARVKVKMVDWFAAVSDKPGWCWYRQLLPTEVPEGLVADCRARTCARRQ